MSELELLKKQIEALKELVEIQKQTIDALKAKDLVTPVVPYYPIVIPPNGPAYPVNPIPSWEPNFQYTPEYTHTGAGDSASEFLIEKDSFGTVSGTTQILP
jgi:hypothetical protein